MAIDPTQPIPRLPAEDRAAREILGGVYGRDGNCRPSTSSAIATPSAARREPRALRAGRGGRDPAPPATGHVRQPALAPSQAGPARAQGRRPGGRPLGTDDPGRRRRDGRRRSRDRLAAHAAPGADPRRRGGQAPDLAVLDSVWAAEFAAAGFLYALEDLNDEWIRDEHEVDFLDALVAANRYAGGRSASRPSPTSPGSGTGVASSRPRGSSRRRPGRSCAGRLVRSAGTVCRIRS